MINWLSNLLDRVFAVGGALICFQAPVFMQQYGHQLSGRVEELKLQINGMMNVAIQGQKTLPQFIQRFIESGDPDFMRQGQLMQWTSERYEKLSEAYQALTHASVISKPFVFLRDFNWTIAQSTFNEYQPGISFTFEGMVYGLLGIGLGYGLFYLLSGLVNGFFGLFRRKRVVEHH